MPEPGGRDSWLDARFDWVASLLIAVGIAARFYGLDINGYWYDELVSMVGADPSRSFTAVVLESPPNAVHPPLFHLVLWVWRGLFGDGERVVRLLSALIGTGTVTLAFVAGRHLMSRSTNRMFVTLMACAFGGIVYSQETRPYVLLMLLGTALTLITLRAIREMEAGEAVSFSMIAALVTTGVLVAHTHYFGILFTGAVLIVLLHQAYARGLPMRDLVLSGAAILFLVAPWLAYELPRKMNMAGSAFWPRTDVSWLVDQMQRWTIYVLGSGAILLVAAVIVRIYRTARLAGPRAAALSPLTSLLATIPITCVLAALVSLHTPLTVARYFLVAAPAALLTVALALDEGPFGFPSSYRLRQAMGFACGILMLIPLADYYEPFKQQYREAARYLQAHERCRGEPVLAWRHPGWSTDGLAEYRLYMRPETGIRLVSTDSASVGAIRESNGECPILVWAAHPSTGTRWQVRVAQELGLEPDSVEVVPFIGTFLIREPGRSTGP